MRQFNFSLTDAGELKDIFDSGRLPVTGEFKSLLVQIFSANENADWYLMISIIEAFDQPQIYIEIDPGKIAQVLNNLVGNAIKYSKSGTTVIVGVYKSGDSIVTEVADQGVGIKPDEIEKLFQPFERTSSRPTSNESSHGLGLAIVKKIIEGHGGSVGVRSEWGKGSTFYFSLPLVK